MVPAPPGREDDAGGGDGEQSVLADAVGEVLRDVRGELADRLALGHPRRDGEALAARREPLPDPNRDLEVAGLVRGISRRLRECPHGVVALSVGAVGEVRAEVRGLHDPEPAASDHQVAALGQRRRELDHAPVVPVGRHGPRAAHDADHRPGALHEKAGQGAVDEVVVRPLGEAFDHVRRASAVGLDVPVDAPVQRGGVIRPGVPALHQVVARVQALRTHDVGTLDVAQDVLESELAAAHLRPNTINRRGGEQAVPSPRRCQGRTGPQRGVLHGSTQRAGAGPGTHPGATDRDRERVSP